MNDLLRESDQGLEQQHLSSSSSCDYRYATTEQSSTSCDKPEDIELSPKFFRNIIVRPQWLRRVVDSPVGFRAELTDGLDTNDVLPTPVIFFINKLAGGQKGEKIYRKLVRLVNPRQVFLLENDATIIQALNIYSSLVNIRICACGGDGTVGWVLSRLIDVFPSLENPPVSIYPLGTANDLSRVLGWGYQYDPKRLLRVFTQIPHAQTLSLDCWQVKFETLEMTSTGSNQENTVADRRRHFFLYHPKFVRNTNQLKYENHLKPVNRYFFSHISFGLDAAIALDFHVRRTGDPSKFTSPLKNKILYLNESRKYFKEFFFSGAWNLGLYMRLFCDGQDLTDSIRSCHTLVLLNSSGYASGTNPWIRTLTNRNNTSAIIQRDDNSFKETSTNSNIQIDTSTHTRRFNRQDCSDRKIEVLELNTTQMGLIHLGFKGHRIAQCNQVRLELSRPISVQMDGEPFYLVEPTTVNIIYAGQVSVLRNDNR
ncbi:unnamed protein product [Rotaria sp. Silwood2]|nr:unnamed protein product [Rotaria sp. Silwood2]CAF4007414.1 unnamed protein product [Rotaria sp. Silwood2]